MKQEWLNALIFAVIISSLTFLAHERNKAWISDINLWKDAAEKAPGNARAHNNLGKAFGAVGRDSEAIIEFKKAIKLLPRYALAHMNVAISYSKLDLPDEAESHFRQAVEFYPTLSDTYYNYGFFLYSQMRYKEAYEILTRYINLNPRGPFVPFTYKLLSDIEKRGYGK